MLYMCFFFNKNPPPPNITSPPHPPSLQIKPHKTAKPADIAFEATGCDLPELFTAAADATMNVMIENIDSIEPRETRHIEFKNDKLDMLLFDFLQELIYFKDAERLLLRVHEMRIDDKDGHYFLDAATEGE